MRKAAAFLLLLLVLPLSPLSAQRPGLTPNTLAYDSTQPRVKAALSDIAWLTGHWRGPALGGVSEEVWTAPEANSMMGMYRLMKDDGVVFYEIFTVVPDDGGLTMLLKHFNADLAGWEERDEVLHFRLLKVTPSEAFFDGITYRRVDADNMEVLVAIRGRDGTVREEVFRYTRVK